MGKPGSATSPRCSKTARSTSSASPATRPTGAFPRNIATVTSFLRRLLERLALPAERLFLVPGNHDIERGVHATSWAALRGTLGRVDALDLARWMRTGATPPAGVEPAWREEVLARQRAWRVWVADELGRPELMPERSPHGALGWRVTLRLPGYGFPVHLVGLDTAWLCGDEQDATRLRLTDAQVLELTGDADGRPLDGFRLALLHHPFGELADGAEALRLLAERVDLALRGHLHEVDLAAWADPDRRLACFAAGCLYEGSRADQWPNGLQVLTLELADDGRPLRGEVRLRSWAPRGHWYDDDGLYRDSHNGRLAWEFPRDGRTVGRAGTFVNPYDPWTPATPPRFVGRASERRRLALALDERRSVSIIGYRRSGKSSLLETWASELVRRGRAAHLLSGERGEGLSIAAFVAAATGADAPEGADAAADTLGRWAERSPLPPVLLVDEADGLFERFDVRFFERLRGMLGRVVLVLATRLEVDLIYRRLSHGSPFANRLELLPVGLLAPEPADAVIGWGVPVFGEGGAALMREWAGRHPFYLQLLGHHLVDAGRDGNTRDEALDQFRFEAAARLRDVWRGLDEAERRTMRDAGRGRCRAAPEPAPERPGGIGWLGLRPGARGMAARGRVVNSPPELPGFPRWVWMFFMQPIRLNRLLRGLDIPPDAPAWRLLRTGDGDRSLRRAYVARMLATLVVLPATIIAGTLLVWYGPTDLFPASAIVGVAVGVAAAWPSAWPSARPSAWPAGGRGVGIGVAVGVAVGVGWPAAWPSAWPSAWPLARPSARPSAGRRRGRGVGIGVAVGVAAGVGVGMVIGMVSGMASGVASVVAFGAAFIAFNFRLPLWPIEGGLQTLLYLAQMAIGRVSLGWAPVLWHDLSYLPHPFLHPHILATADADPDLARRVIERCADVPGQRRTGEGALHALQARELQDLAGRPDFVAASELRGLWLPGVEVHPLLLAFRDVAAQMRAAQAVLTPYHRLGYLEGAAQRLAALDNRLIADRSELAAHLRPVARAWRATLENLLRGAEAEAAHVLPNPFRAGEPLTPEQGMALFRGREAVIRSIEGLLADAATASSIALLAPRRCGKSSLLNMLPVKLPDALCVFFDVQDNPADSLEGFAVALVGRAQAQARRAPSRRCPTCPRATRSRRWGNGCARSTKGGRGDGCCSPSTSSSAWRRSGPATGGNSSSLWACCAPRSSTAAASGCWSPARPLQRARAGLERPLHQRPRDPFQPPQALGGGRAVAPADSQLPRRRGPGGGGGGGGRAERGAAVPGPALREPAGQPPQRRGQAHGDVGRRRGGGSRDCDRGPSDQLLPQHGFRRAGVGARGAGGPGPRRAGGTRRHTRGWLRSRALIDDDDQLTVPVLGRWIREEEVGAA